MADNDTVDKSVTGQADGQDQAAQGGGKTEKSWEDVLRGLGSGDAAENAGNADEGDGKAKATADDKADDKAAAGGSGEGGGVTLDKESLAEMFTQAVKAAQPADKPKEYTEEELRQALNIFQATEAHLEQLGLEKTPARAEALNNILQNVAKQATSVATFELRAALSAMTEKLQPVFSYMEESRMQAMKERFFKKHGDLEGLEPLVVVAHQRLKAKGVKFNGETEAFNAVAEETRAILSKLPGYKPGKQTETKTKGESTTPPRKMPALSGGGSGGAGDTKGQTSGPKWARVLS